MRACPRFRVLGAWAGHMVCASLTPIRGLVLLLPIDALPRRMSKSLASP